MTTDSVPAHDDLISEGRLWGDAATRTGRYTEAIWIINATRALERQSSLLASARADGDSLTIPKPHVPFGPKGVPENIATADYLDSAARNIRNGYAVGGYNVTTTVINLLHNAATALRAAVPLTERNNVEPPSQRT